MDYCNIEKIIREVNKDMIPQFEDNLRGHLKKRDKPWLVEQIIRLTLDKHSLQQWDRKVLQKVREEQRARRRKRLKRMKLDETKLDAFIKRYEKYDRTRLEKEEHLINPPAKGMNLITSQYRSKKGEMLLIKAKDILFAILFGDKSTDVNFNRVERELLTLTLPRFKAQAIDFMKAATEIGGLGSWQDPDDVSNDDRTENVILQVEYGEVASERIGDGIISTLSLINNLEVNEQILYARMINVEQSSLIS